MTDQDFLTYCETHAETPRRGFVPEQVLRLIDLSGQVGLDGYTRAWWAKQGREVFSIPKREITRAVTEARRRNNFK